MKESKKLAFLLPNAFTALNVAFGFLAIIAAAEGKIDKSCMYIFFSALFDSVDGRVARLTGTSSSFGEQFDSLSDLISFGLAPAITLFFTYYGSGNRSGVAICFLFLLCGALRLARFNVSLGKSSSDYFQGAPIPGAALAVVSLISVTGSNADSSILYSIYIIFYSLLMISSIPFPSFKNSSFFNNKKKLALFSMFICLILLYVFRLKIIFILLNLYVVLSIFYYLKNRSEFSGAFDWADE